MYARTAVPVDSKTNVVGGKSRQKVFAFWFPSSYCPILWPRICMGVWPAPSRKTSLRRWETVVADHRYTKTYILSVCTYIPSNMYSIYTSYNYILYIYIFVALISRVAFFVVVLSYPVR